MKPKMKKQRKIQNLYRYIEIEIVNKMGRKSSEIYSAKHFTRLLEICRRADYPSWEISAILYTLESDERLMLAKRRNRQ